MNNRDNALRFTVTNEDGSEPTREQLMCLANAIHYGGLRDYMPNKHINKQASLEKVAIGDTEEGRHVIEQAIRNRYERTGKVDATNAPFKITSNNPLYDKFEYDKFEYDKFEPIKFEYDKFEYDKFEPYTFNPTSNEDIDVDWKGRAEHYKGRHRVGGKYYMGDMSKSPSGLYSGDASDVGELSRMFTDKGTVYPVSEGYSPVGNGKNSNPIITHSGTKTPPPNTGATPPPHTGGATPKDGNFFTKNKKNIRNGLIGAGVLGVGAAGAYFANKYLLNSDNGNKYNSQLPMYKQASLEKIAIGDTEEGRRVIEQAIRNRHNRLLALDNGDKSPARAYADKMSDNAKVVVNPARYTLGGDMELVGPFTIKKNYLNYNGQKDSTYVRDRRDLGSLGAYEKDLGLSIDWRDRAEHYMDMPRLGGKYYSDDMQSSPSRFGKEQRRYLSDPSKKAVLIVGDKSAVGSSTTTPPPNTGATPPPNTGATPPPPNTGSKPGPNHNIHDNKSIPREGNFFTRNKKTIRNGFIGGGLIGGGAALYAYMRSKDKQEKTAGWKDSVSKKITETIAKHPKRILGGATALVAPAAGYLGYRLGADRQKGIDLDNITTGFRNLMENSEE